MDDKDVIMLVDGHCRLEGVKLARSEGCAITTIPATTTPAGTSMEDLLALLFLTNSDGKLSPHATAKLCKRMIGIGMEISEVGKRFLLTPTYVESLLLLVAAPRAVRDLVEKGTISATLAISTLREHGSDASKVLTKASEVAKASGKTRVTKKALSPAKQKVEKDKNAKRDLLAEGAEWIALHPEMGDDNGLEQYKAKAMISFLAFIVGVTEEVVVEHINKSFPLNKEGLNPLIAD